MTRINTNVSSLNAQKTLSRNTQALQTALTRLSTGLRINTGKDDPAGMIAAEIMHNNIVAVQKAISNTQRGTQMIATIDSALGSITSLLHDIRSLVTEAGNTGVMSEEQIAANQMQVDSALEAINRIAQVTKFQGRRVLDGSLDFITNANTIPQIRNLKIDQANLGATGQMEVAVEIEKAATRATITTSSGDDYATTRLYFSSRVLVSGTAGGSQANLFIAARSNSQEFDGVQVIFDGTQSAVSATYDATSKILTIGFDNDTSTVGDILTAIENTGLFEAYANVAGTTVANSFTNANMAMDYITITADNKGTDYNNVTVRLQRDDALNADTAVATYDAVTKQITVRVTGEDDFANYTTLQAIAGAINSYLGDYFTASASTNGTRVYGALASDLAARASTGVSGYLKSAFSEGTRAQATLTFAAGATKVFNVSGATTATVDIKANSLGAQAANVVIQFLDDVTAGNEYAEYNESAKSLVVHYAGGSTTVDRLAEVIEATGAWTVTVRNNGDRTLNAGGQTSVRTGQDTLTVESILPGSNFNNMQVRIMAQTGLSSPVAMYDRATNTFTIKVNYSDTQATTLLDIANAINSVEGFAAYYRPNGIGQIYGNSVDNTVVGNTGGSGGNALLDDLVLELAGRDGMEVFTFYRGTTANQVAAAVNAVSDALGLIALQDNELVSFKSLEYGSKQFVSVNVINEGPQGTFTRSVSAFRATGTDVQGKINGVTATADGNRMWINTSMLDMTIDLAPETDDNFKFTILGGGAQFQLGPDVVTNQQIRMGIKSLNTARLGGTSGKLYQLQTGGNADLYTNPNLAAKIVNEAIGVVTELRGRLGALEGLTMQTNIKTMEDTLENMTNAESQIRDADFAAETANLTRAQVLVQSGMAVLTIANQNPQNVLALLR